jgi:hypothetical protein
MLRRVRRRAMTVCIGSGLRWDCAEEKCVASTTTGGAGGRCISRAQEGLAITARLAPTLTCVVFGDNSTRTPGVLPSAMPAQIALAGRDSTHDIGNIFLTFYYSPLRSSIEASPDETHTHLFPTTHKPDSRKHPAIAVHNYCLPTPASLSALLHRIPRLAAEILGFSLIPLQP